MSYLSNSAVARNEIPIASYTGLVFESFTRAINGAPIQNRRAVFHLIAIDCYRRCFTDLRALAEASGLVEIFGTVTIEDDLAAALEGGAVVRSIVPLKVTMIAPADNADIDADEYGRLSSTFACACRTADRDRATPRQVLPFRPRDRDHLPASTKQTIDWLLKYTDEQRLRGFLERRSEEELLRIEHYISRKKSQ